MTNKYEKFIIYEPEMDNVFHKPGTFPGIMLIAVNHDILPEATFHFGCCWWSGVTEFDKEADAMHPHYHKGDEIVGILSSDPNDPFDLKGRSNFWYEHEKFTVDKSCLFYIPAGVTHAPMWQDEVNRPVFTFSTQLSPVHAKDHNDVEDPVMTPDFLKNTPPVTDYAKSKWGKYVRFEQETSNKAHEPGTFPGTMLIAADGNNIPNAKFHFGSCWWGGSVTKQETWGPHVHDHDEIIGLFGSNLDDPFNLNAEVHFWFEHEEYVITRSCVIFIPAGIKHAPMWYKKVDKPMLTFSINWSPLPPEHTTFIEDDSMFSEFAGAPPK